MTPYFEESLSLSDVSRLVFPFAVIVDTSTTASTKSWTIPGFREISTKKNAVPNSSTKAKFYSTGESSWKKVS